ncbi:MAG: S9 family peptidase [Acidobacteriota bacterium]|nr:S9 family peptidase [Acidobacteriota bacterium]
MKRGIALLMILLGAVPAAATSAEKKRLTMRDMLSFRLVSQPALSRDGRRVAFVVAEADFQESRYRTDIWVVETEGGKPRPFTRSREDESMPRWSPDGRWLAFLSNRPGRAPEARQEEEEDRRPKNQIWIMPSDGGEAVQLTQAEEGVIAYEWAPDSRAIIYLTRETLPKPERERRERERKYKFDAIVEEKERYRREFWTVEIETRKATRLFEGDYGIAEFEVSPEGKRIAYATNYTGRVDDGKKFDIWVFSLDEGRARQLTRRPGGERSPRWSPDGRWIAFLAPQIAEIPYSQSELFLVPADGGEWREVTKAFDRGVEGGRWHPAGRDLYALALLGTETHLVRIPIDGGSPEPITRGARVISAFDLSADGRTLVLLSEDARSLPDLWLLRSGSNDLTRLTEMNPQLQEFEIAEHEVIRWKSVDGLEIEGVLVKPVGYEPGKRYPLLVAVHGGPHSRVVNAFRQYYNFQIWAANGYAVFAPNFRGSSGYDGKFDIANRRDLGGKDFQDIMTGVDHLIRIGLADPDRLGIFGGSYGGYMTNWAITQTDRFKAAISMYGIFNLITDFSNSYLPSWEPDYLGAYYWDDLDIYIRRSPFAYVKNIKTPVLILHGEADPNTFISNSKEMYTALTHLGKTVEFVRYPREGHGFRELNHRLDEMRRCLEWFDRYVKGGAKTEYGLEEWVPAGDWEFEVASVNPNVAYPGQATDGTMVEVTLLFKSKGRESRALELHLERDVVVLDETGQTLAPRGIPVEVAGARALVMGGGRFVAAPVAGEATTYVPLRLTFEVPKGRQAVRLRVRDFPSVNLQARWRELPRS